MIKYILIPFLLIGCTPTVIYEKPNVNLPIMPVVPYIEAEELHCVSDNTYRKLVERELRIREHAEECIVILKEVTTQ